MMRLLVLCVALAAGCRGAATTSPCSPSASCASLAPCSMPSVTGACANVPQGADAGHVLDAAAGPAVDAAPPPQPIAPRGPAPSAKACVPTGPLLTELGAAGAMQYMGPRKLAAVASGSVGLFVLDPADGILRMPMGKAAIERVAATKTATDFLSADLHVYWYENGVIWRASNSAIDAAPDRVGGGLQHPALLLNYDATNLYFADRDTKTIVRLTLSGEMFATLASGVDARDLKLHAGQLYYADASSQQAYRVSAKGDVAPELLTSGTNFSVSALDTDGTTLFWADGAEIRATPIGKPTMRQPIGRAGPGPGGTDAGLILRMLLNGDRVYFIDDGGNVGWTATDGSACGLLVKNAGNITGFDVDATTAYVTVVSGTGSELWKIAHP